MNDTERIITTTGSHNCGGRCLLDVHIKGNTVTRIRGSATRVGPDKRRLTPCGRCGGYLDRLYHPDRLKYPLKRIGRRGEGRFARISWEEATDLISSELTRITGKYGPESRYIHYGSGIMGKLAERNFFRRLLTLYGGGYLNYYNSYSTACTAFATPFTYGTDETGSSRDNWLHSKLIILWGHNPAETIFTTNTFAYLKEAKKQGARIIVVDPRRSDSANLLADQWIPLLPTTDNALMDAMSWVILTEELYDREFVDRFCLGFDEEQMPDGIPAGNSLKAYLLGEADGVPKSPEWAAEITHVPADVIRSLAREYATAKPAALIQGYGPQRHAMGEQPVRGATVLAAITGNVGIPGGWASGSGFHRRLRLASIPCTNPVKAAIPVFRWTDAIEKGIELGRDDGILFADRLQSNIKFLASLAGNCLVNQHSDINRTVRILEDESQCEFILVSDEFMTSSALYADLVLPSSNFLERMDIVDSGAHAEYVILQQKAVEPEFERRTGYDWIADVAGKLGVREAFTAGRSYEGWLRYLVDSTRAIHPDFPSWEMLYSEGLYYPDYAEPDVAFRDQIEDPANNPFPTPSGKIEIFSERLYNLNRPDEIPAIPKYLPCWEGPDDPLRSTYPLQLIGWHSKRSAHSTFSNLSRTEKIVPMELWMNPADASVRQIVTGDRVQVYNERGELEIPVRVTDKIIAGVVALPQGAWHRPDGKRTDQGANINTLTRYRPTPLAHGNPQHTNLVEVRRT